MTLGQLLRELELEFDSACRRHPPMHSPHEGYAVILEELDELWKHIKADRGRHPAAGREALQVAAMALRYLLDVTYGQE